MTAEFFDPNQNLNEAEPNESPEEAKEPTPSSEEELTTDQELPAPSAEELDQDIHTMPEKFLSQSTGGKKKIWLGIGIIAGVVIVMAAAGLYFFTDLFKASKPTGGNIKPVSNINQTVTNVNLAQNLNANQNLNVNGANQNLNAHLNVNGVNQNINQNANANLNVNAANQNQNLNQNVNASRLLPTSKDTDADGLTDVEEQLYQTNTTKADTDGDGYFDGAEVLAGYSPTTTQSTRLKDTDLVAKYSNLEQGYALNYPSSWVARAVTQSKSEVVFAATTGEYIQIAIQDNKQNISAQEWYSQVSGAANANQVTVLTLAGTQAVLTPDLASVYLTKNGKMYILSYNPGTLSEVNYRTTFKMIYQSISFTKPTLTTNTNANVNTAANTNSAVNTNTAQNQNSNSNVNKQVKLYKLMVISSSDSEFHPERSRLKWRGS